MTSPRGMVFAMGAQSRLFTSLASGSGKATAVVVCAVMLLAGCSGSGGSAAESSARAIRGDVALPDTFDPGDSGVTSPFDPEVIEGILKDSIAKVGGEGLAEGDFIIDDAEAFKFIIGDAGAFQTVVKPPSDDSVVIFEESDEQIIVMGAKFEVYEDDAGKYRFRLRALDGGIVAVGEPYDTMAAAKEACASVKRAAAIATVVEADS